VVNPVAVALPLGDGVVLSEALGLREVVALGVVGALRVVDGDGETNTLALALSVAVEDMLGDWEAVMVDEAVAAVEAREK
jgi:hypothetical protein